MKIPHLRWIIAGLLLAASTLNYVDRQTLSILAPTIQGSLGMTDARYGTIVSLFLAAYTVAFLISGRVVDRLGTRLSMTVFAAGWSAANLVTGFARSVAGFGACRALLGFFEAGCYTASPKIVGEWFQPKERGVAVGLYSVGGALGATLAPVLVVAITVRYGWRAAFVVTGAIGLVFAAIWWLFYRSPESASLLTDADRRLVPERARAPVGLSEGGRWALVLRNPAVWALVGARMLTDPVWYFFQFWFPKYLHAVRGFAQMDLSTLWIVFLAADIGFIASGIAAGYLIARGSSPMLARRKIMIACACLVPLAPLIPSLSGTTAMFAVAMAVVFAHAAWMASVTTYAVDLIPDWLLGTAGGCIAAGSAVGGIIMNQAVVWVISRWSYSYCFDVMVVLHPLAFLLVWRFARRSRREEPGSVENPLLA